MRAYPLLSRCIAAATCWTALVCIFSPRPCVAAAAWQPLTPEILAAEPSAAALEAGAEVLLREITVDDSDWGGTSLDHYIRIRVLSDRGIEALAKMEIPFDRGRRVRNLAARVVRPDGTSIELDRKAFFTRDVVRLGRDTLSVMSFSFPALEPGCIAEYRFRVQSEDAIGGMRLYLADPAFPVAHVRFRIRPFDYPGLRMRSIWSRRSNLSHQGRDRRGFEIFEASNIPVENSEPLAPPDDTIKRWFLFYFTQGDTSPTTYWWYMAGELIALGDLILAPKKPLQDAARKIVAGAASQEEQLQRLYDFCRTQIKNLSHDVSGYTPEQMEKLRPNKTPADTLKNGYGTNVEINLLFGALLRSTGLRCSLAWVGDRSQSFFSRELTTRSTLPHLLVATDWGPWRLYDPGSLYLPAGKLRWMQENSAALVATRERWEIIKPPASELDYSTTRRTAQLRLTAGGAIEGDVTITMSGHDGVAVKHQLDALSAAEVRTLLEQEMESRLGPVEISDVNVLHATDPDQPVVVSYRVKAASFAEYSEDRVFLQPSFFEKGRPALFSAEQREFDICFPYPSLVEDEVTIDLPEGFALEQANAPRPLSWQNNVNYLVNLSYHTKAHRLVYARKYRRTFSMVAARAYPVVKSYFTEVHQQDHHTILLRRTAAADSAPSASATEAVP